MLKLASKSRLFAIRIVLFWIPLLVGTWLIFSWSRTGDPRFYSFMDTRPGQIISRTFDWHDVPMVLEPREKTIDELTDEELSVKKQIEEELQASRSEHRLTFHNKRTMEGPHRQRVQEIPPFRRELWRQRPCLREDQKEANKIHRDIISANSRSYLPRRGLPDGIPEYAPLQERAVYYFNRRILFPCRRCDACSYGGCVMTSLYNFRDLVVNPESERAIQIIFFSNEKSFRTCQEKYAPHMDNTAGFYSPWGRSGSYCFNQGFFKANAGGVWTGSRSRTEIHIAGCEYRSTHAREILEERCGARHGKIG